MVELGDRVVKTVLRFLQQFHAATEKRHYVTESRLTYACFNT